MKAKMYVKLSIRYVLSDLFFRNCTLFRDDEECFFFENDKILDTDVDYAMETHTAKTM